MGFSIFFLSNATRVSNFELWIVAEGGAERKGLLRWKHDSRIDKA